MTQAQLKDIFKNRYNPELWQQILINVFGASTIRREPKSLENAGNANVEGFELGQIQAPDGYLIGLFEFEIKKKHKLSMNRIGLRGLVRSFLHYNIDGALVVYYDKNEWRLSFISDLGGDNEKTAPKRFTYLFGSEAESYRTPTERFISLEEERGDKTATFKSIREAFSVEKLGKDFFREYKEQYRKFVAHISATDSKDDRDYCKKLLGRLVFLQFVQKKKWLGEDLNFMRNLFAKSEHRDNFLKKVLEPLFFDTLNTPRQGDVASDVFGAGVRIPYLNGGLFEKDKLDETTHNFLPSYFEELFDFFGQYNFTIDENDPNDAEVGIDPEMLGHIFENLLEDNKDKGAFYTPKEIVQYMSRESLSQYLKNHTEESIHPYVNQLVNRNEVVVELQNKDTASKLNTLLKDVKICDPAIGSGAFPMGVLNEIFALRKLLYPFLDNNSNFKPADIKRDIIQNNIYGVDIEQGAVDIARLRFWLSLVVDEQQPEPLPNLDYKIMQGNSLLESFEGVDLSFYREKGSVSQGTLDFGGAEQTQNEIKELIHEYFAVTDHVRKVELRDQIDAKVNEHIKRSCADNPGVADKVDGINPTNRPFFLWHVYFNDVFERGGFDIVIANPPYVVVKRGTYKNYNWDTDLYLMFFELALFRLMKPKAVLSYITPKFFLVNLTNSKLREYFLKNTSICNLVETSPFEAITENVITTLTKDVPQSTHIKVLKESKGKFLEKNSIEITYCLSNPNNEIILSLKSNVIKILDKVKLSSIELGSMSSSKRGAEVSNAIIKKTQEGVPTLIGGDVRKYFVSWANHNIPSNHKEARRLRHFFDNDNMIYLRRVGNELTAAVSDDKFLCNKNIYGISLNDNSVSKMYIVALLNSKLLDFYYKQRFSTKKENVFPEIQTYLFEVLPIKLPESQLPFIDLVDRILETKRIDPKADTSALETEIDRMVYTLYGLTDEEIGVVENK